MSIDTKYLVRDDKEGVYVEVGPWDEVPTCVVIECGSGPKSKEQLGPQLFGVAMSPQFARDLGTALIKAASNVEKQS